MREEPGEARLRTRILAGIWASSTLVLAWHAGADVAGGDSGEIGGAALALGVAHPTGFALDMLLLRSFALLPLGSLAWRENLAVVCISAGVATSLAWLTVRLGEQLGVARGASSAIGAGLTVCALFGFRTFVASAVGVEVYSSALLLLTCGALITLSERRAHAAALWPLFGLALGAHVTAALLMLPLLATNTICAANGPRFEWPRWLATRTVMVAAGALIITYLPLASAHDRAFDWGDPGTLHGLLRHLSAARIRDAYGGAMFTPYGTAALALFAQLAEHPWLLMPGMLAGTLLWLRRRGVALVILAVLSFDLAYAVWVNPMGIGERQLGHASGALLALLAGVGGAWLTQRCLLRSRLLGSAVALTTIGSSALLLTRVSWPEGSDGYAVAERYGAGSPLLDLAPRAVYLCSTDSACANALLAIYAEGARPDIVVAPAQHLWDQSVTRRLSGMSIEPLTSASLGPEGKRERAARVLRTLASRYRLRPIVFELLPQPSVGDSPTSLGLRHAPWIDLDATEPDAQGSTGAAAFDQLAALERARFGIAGPRTQLARELWASAHAEVGKLYLQTGRVAQALSALGRTVELTPGRAVAHSNLGVAFELAGDLAAALRETRLAVESDPARPTPWVNLTRLLLRVSGPEAARAALAAAEGNAVRDARLDRLREALERDHGSTEK
jgi:tetratricopeptide (TPR) repeat protein